MTNLTLRDVYLPQKFSPSRKIGREALAKMFMSRVSLLSLVVNRPHRGIDGIFMPIRRNPSQSMPLIKRNLK